MINKINIKDFAIIDDINIDFNPGLTVITGETGSGKSIIIEAISSLINGKFLKSSIRHGALRSVVNLEFEVFVSLRHQLNEWLNCFNLPNTNN